jgi:hypothetical protein
MSLLAARLVYNQLFHSCMRSVWTGSNLIFPPCINNAEPVFALSPGSWYEQRMLPCSFHADRQSEKYDSQCLHATSVDNSAQCPAVVMLSVKTPLISLSSPYVIPRPGCCALDHSCLTDGRKCLVLHNCVQTKELRCDEAFILISVHRSNEFHRAAKQRKLKKSSLCLNCTKVA